MSSTSQHATQETDLLQSADTIKFDEDRELYHVDFDPTQDTASLAIIAAVATASQTDPFDMEPLHSVIDTGALDKLTSTSKPSDRCSISFSFTGFNVTVAANGRVVVENQSESTNSNG